MTYRTVDTRPCRCSVGPGPSRLVVFCLITAGMGSGCALRGSRPESCAGPGQSGPRDVYRERSAWGLQQKEPFAWPEGKRVAVSLTFDDARLSQVDVGLPVLDRHDVRATFYVSLPQLGQRLDHWRKALDTGHEIGNHSLEHPCSGNFTWARQKALEDYTLERMRQELEQASAEIERLLGVRPTTFAYPCGQTFVGRDTNTRSYVPVVAEAFLVGRRAYDEIANDPRFCDLARATGMELDGLDFEEARQLLGTSDTQRQSLENTADRKN